MKKLSKKEPTKQREAKWPIVKLGNVCDVRDGTHESPKYLSKGIPFITSKNLKNRKIDFSNIRYISQEDHESFSRRSKVDNGDILFGMIGSIGNPVVVNKDKEFSIKNVALFKFNKNKKIINYFLQILLKSSFTKNSLVKKATGGSQKFVSLADLRNFKIPLPPLSEQKKIVEILSTWDKAIEKLDKLISAKEQQFKWLLKKLITDQKNKSSWKKMNLGDIVTMGKGKQLNKLTLQKSGKYYVQNGGIEPSGYTDKYNTAENTITISEGGNSCGFVKFNKTRFWAGGHCYFLANLSNKLDKNFLYYQLKANEKRIMRLRVGSGLPNIQKKDINDFQIVYPPLKEQKKIVKTLSTNNQELETLKQLSKKYEKQKQGLMQKLLTGKIRL